MAKNNTRKAKKGGTPNKGTIRSYLQNFTLEAVDTLLNIMRNSRNENLKFAAAKVFVDKSLADLKSVEMGGEDGGPIVIKIVPESIVYGAGTDRTANQELPQAAVDL